MVYVNMLIGAAGFTIYGLWAGKWARRHAWGLATLNGITSLIILGFTFGYAAIVWRPNSTTMVSHGLLRYLVPLLIAIPVLTRIAEYRRDQAREQYAREAVRELTCDDHVA